MGLREFFEIKSLRQKKEEQLRYNQWAFPYGQAQLQLVNDRLLQLMPDEKKTGLAVFLLGKEAWEKDGWQGACRAMKDHLPGKHGRKLPLFLALVEADAAVEENLSYPAAEDLRRMAAKWEEML